MDDETCPKMYKHLIRNELKRGLLCQTSIKLMPPELIITPAQRSANGDRATSAKQANSDGEEIRLLDGSTLMMSQLPPIYSPPKRHNTWHNFKKCVPSLRYSREIYIFFHILCLRLKIDCLMRPQDNDTKYRLSGLYRKSSIEVIG